MSAITAQPSPPRTAPRQAGTRARTRVADRWMLGAVVVSGLPLALLQMWRLWQSAHYQFFPALLLASGFLIRRGWPTEDVEHSPFATFGANVLLVTGALMQAAALLLLSPWLGLVALILSSGGVLWYLTGSSFRAVMPAWSLLFLMVQLPFNLDQRLVTSLQLTTASLSSALLNMMGVLHLAKGVVIELPGREFFVEEACSGIQSLFSLLAIAGVYAVFRMRSLVSGLTLVASAALVSILINVLRVVTIVTFAAVWQVDLIAEPGHTIFGLSLFAVAVGWVLSADKMVNFWLAPIPYDNVEEKGRSRFSVLFNRITGGSSARIERANARLTAAQEKLVGPVTLLGRGPMILAAVCGICVLAGELFAYPILKPELLHSVITQSASNMRIVQAMESLNEETLSDEYEGWTRTGFEATTRPSSSIFGQYSRSWQFQATSGQALVSVDYPFRGWHDLLVCYRNVGWTLSSADVVSEPNSPRKTVIAEMQHETGQQAYLVFDLTSSGLQPIAPEYEYELPRIRDELDRLSDRLRAVADRSWKKVDQALARPENLITFQNQTLLITRTGFSEELQDQVHGIHRKTRDQILAGIRPALAREDER